MFLILGILGPILLTFISFLTVYWFWELYKYRSIASIPGPRAYPLLGNIFPRDAFHLKIIFEELLKKYGKIVRIYFGPDINIAFAGCNEIEAVLGSAVHLEKSKSYEFARSWLGDGLILSSGQKWKTRRKQLTPSLHFKILEIFMKSFDSAGDVLVQQLDKQVGKGSVNIFEMMNLFTLDVICETSMGVKINAQTDKKQPYVMALRRYLEFFIMRVFGTQYQLEWMFRMSKYYSEYKKCVEILQDFADKVIKERRHTYKENLNHEINEDTENDIGVRKTYALLDLLLMSEGNLTNDEIRDEINVFLFAGHDSTSSALTFGVFELAQNSDIQERLYQEIVSVVKSSGKGLTISQLNDMKYLDMICKETLRKYPTIPVFQRKLCEDCYIGGIKYPKGLTTTIMVYELHHDPEIYPRPEKFIPERFLPESVQERHPYAYIPFSAGPRNCIGQKFAQYELKSAIVKILLNFKLLPDPSYKPKLGFMVTLKPKDGMFVTLERRK